MIAKDLMKKDVLCVRESDRVEDLADVLVGENLHGAPVVDAAGELVGVVTQQDLFFSTMTRSGVTDGDGESAPLTVREIMTAPAVSVGEETTVEALCRIMFKLRIHRVPVVRHGRVRGIISSLDVCAAVARGELPVE